jgi:hypothetical protein
MRSAEDKSKDVGLDSDILCDQPCQTKIDKVDVDVSIDIMLNKMCNN